MTHAELVKLTRDPTADTIIVGHALMLRRQGGEWTWSVRYRANGVRRRVTLGKYSRVGLAAARTAASKVLRQVDLGEDPQAAQRAARAAAEAAKRNSIEALADVYIEQHAKKHKRTWRDDQQKLTCEVLPVWKGRSVTSITRRDCRELVQAIADRPAPVFADRIGALLSTLFNFAVAHEILTSNPAWRLPKHTPKRKDRPDERDRKAYTDDEVRQVWENTGAVRPAVRAPIRLGLITAQRPTECTDLEWSEIVGDWWTIPGWRTKNGRTHRVYLTPLARDVLADVPRIEGMRYAFVGCRGKRQLSEANADIFAGVRAREKPRHALRHTAATNMAQLRVSKSDRAKVLNHTDDSGPAITGDYDEYEYDKEKRLALTKWARRLQAILDATTDDAQEPKVVQLGTRRAHG